MRSRRAEAVQATQAKREPAHQCSFVPGVFVSVSNEGEQSAQSRPDSATPRNGSVPRHRRSRRL